MPDDLDYERLKLEKDLSDVLKLKRSFNVFFAAEMNCQERIAHTCIHLKYIVGDQSTKFTVLFLNWVYQWHNISLLISSVDLPTYRY